MANNNYKVAEEALQSINLNNIKIKLNKGKNPKQCINITIFSLDNEILEKSISTSTLYGFETFSNLFLDLDNKYSNSDEHSNKLFNTNFSSVNLGQEILNCINFAFFDLQKDRYLLAARYGLQHVVHEKYQHYIKSIIDESYNDVQENFYNKIKKNKIYTLDEIGIINKVSREAIRQREARTFRHFINNLDNKFEKLITSINMLFNNDNKYIELTNADDLIIYKSLLDDILKKYKNKMNFYITYDIGLIIKNSFQPEDILNDTNISKTLQTKLDRYIYKDCVTIYGKKVKNKRIDILRYFLSIFCRKLTKLTTIHEEYSRMLLDNGLGNRDDLLYDIRTLENILTNENNILLSRGKEFRYYEPEYIEEIINNIDLSVYKNSIISSNKIFNDNRYLMEKYDVDNCYILHNLLSKNIINDNIVLKKMPTICFGESNRDNQVLELLKRLAPINGKELAQAYEDEYGDSINTVLGGYFKTISKYKIGNEYTLNPKIMPEEDLNKLKKVLDKDFYWLEDFEKIYFNHIDDKDGDYLNSFNLNKLNYTMGSTYIYANQYSSFSDYMQQFLSNEIIDMNRNSKLRSVQTFYNYFTDKKNNMELIEFNPDMYINIHKLESVGIDKNILLDYQKKTKEFCEDLFFTVYSLRNNGFKYSILDNLGFEDYFYSSVLINDKEIQFKKISNVYLMRKDNNPFNIADFLIYIMGKLRKVDIYDLCDYIKKQYGLDINRYKIVAITKECSLYYNQISEKVYINYDEFYSEI